MAVFDDFRAMNAQSVVLSAQRNKGQILSSLGKALEQAMVMGIDCTDVSESFLVALNTLHKETARELYAKVDTQEVSTKSDSEA